jgi:hypothetical protein
MFRLFVLFLSLSGGLMASGRARVSTLIELPGGEFSRDKGGSWSGPLQQTLAQHGGRQKESNVLERKVNFPVRGVWYLWLKARATGEWPALLTWSLDGAQPLQSSRKEILIQPEQKASWYSFSRFPNFRIEINVDKPGDHVLRFHQLGGNPQIEKIYCTLFFSAKLKGDTLDMSGDPGEGWQEKPLAGWERDGFKEDFKSPKIPATSRTYKAETDEDITRFNTMTFKPGDVILLKRGMRFKQGLAPQGSGTEKAPITLGAYGSGDRPLVIGVQQAGLHLKDQSWWRIQDLAFSSNPDYRQDALWLEVSDEKVRSRGVQVINCLAFDSGRHGINIGGNAGYDGVLVENCLSFCNSGDGVVVHGSTQKSCRNSVIRACTVYSNPGMAGIWIEGGENGLIDECVAYNNACVNIWCWNAINITMRACEAFRGRPQRDAAGFDIDWGSQACTLEYCYSHHNEGDSVLLMGSGDGDYLGYTMQSNYNLMRYCVAEGHTDAGETFNHSLVHNNLMVGGGGPKDNIFKLFGWPNNDKGYDGGWPVDTRFLNNVLLARGEAVPMYIDDHGTDQGNTWDHNLYWKESKTGPLIKWGGRQNGPGFWTGDRKKGTFPPKDYKNLEDFQKATGQEAGGLQADPKLEGKTGQYDRLPLKSMRLKADSPAAGAGTKVELDEKWLAGRRKFLSETGAEAHGIPMDPEEPKVDYWGKKLNKAAASIGAQEF